MRIWDQMYLHYEWLILQKLRRNDTSMQNQVRKGPGVGQTTTPFGTLFAFQDPSTVTANQSSKVVAIAEGTSITSGLNWLGSISIANITLNMKHYMGSISIVGTLEAHCHLQD